MGNMCARARILNQQPKEKSKSHNEKEVKKMEMMSNKIFCEKCGSGKTTLYNKQGHYYCQKCK